MLAFCQAKSSDASLALYALPLALAWEEFQGAQAGNPAREERLESLRHAAVARVRQRNRVGVLFDAFWDDAFCRALVIGMQQQTRLPFSNGQLELKSTPVLTEIAAALRADDVLSGINALEVKHPSLEQSNTTVMLGDRLMLKGYRRLQQGVNPEIEIGRFLTEVSPFANTAPLAGSVEYVNEKGEVVALGILQVQIANQGSGWAYTVDYLRRFLETRLSVATDQPESAEQTEERAHTVFLPFVQTLARRTAELHRALSVTSGDPAFDPEPITLADAEAWIAQVSGDVQNTFELLEARRDDLPEPLRPQIDRLLALRERALASIERLQEAVSSNLNAVKTRLHGDYHLGQILVAKNDVFIIDFEGEPARPVEERRAKHSALRDVAGMLRSFSYAAASALAGFALERAGERLALAPEARAWEQEVVAAFTAEYVRGMAGCPSYPDDPKKAAALTDFFLMEKALYELRYELNNRPDWVAIPLNGLIALIEAAGASDAGSGAPVNVSTIEGNTTTNAARPAKPARSGPNT